MILRRPLDPPYPSRLRSAFTLIEMLGMLVLLVGLAIVGEQAVAVALRSTRQAGYRADLITRVDASLNLLRRDVWSATALRTDPSGNQLLISQPDGSAIDWTFGDNRLIRTATGSNPLTFQEFPPLRFQVKGPLATLTFTGPAPSPPPSAEPSARNDETSITFLTARLLAGAPQ